MQQSNAAAAAAALYDHLGGGGGAGGDAGDAVMARWLQSAGLQHLASPLGSNQLPNMLMQGYGPQSTEEKQRLLKLMRNLNFNGESGSEPYTPTSQSVAGEDFYSPEFRGDFGAGLLDLHAMDDTELLSEGGRLLTSGSMAAARLALNDSLTKRYGHFLPCNHNNPASILGTLLRFMYHGNMPLTPRLTITFEAVDASGEYTLTACTHNAERLVEVEATVLYAMPAQERESYLKYIETKLQNARLYVQVVPSTALSRAQQLEYWNGCSSRSL